MLQLCVRPSVRFASQLSQSPNDSLRLLIKTTTAKPIDAEGPQRPGSILSRLSGRIQTRRKPVTEQRSPGAHAHEVAGTERRKSHVQATSFVSARSAQQRDHAAEKWFTDIRELDINNANRSNDLNPLSRKKRMRFESPEQYEMRPRTDLNALFAPPPAPSAASSRLQAKKELGGDYTSYLPEGLADPYRLPVDYARLVLGRNKNIPLSSQTGALNIIQQAIQGRPTKQVV